MARNWLSLKEAAAKLDVHPTTLRRWADAGSIPVMLTPGGHRRFDPAEVENFGRTAPEIQTIPVQKIWADKAIMQTRQGIGQRPRAAWMTAQNDESRLQFRQLGQRLMGLAMQYIAMSDGGEDVLDEARDIGRQYAQAGLDIDMPLTDALRASMFFHETLLETSLTMPESAHMRPETNHHILRRINKLLNTVHLSIAAAYER